MKKKLNFFWQTLKESFTEWSDSNATRDSASIAYYAIFSIPGLLIIIIWILGNIFGEVNAEERITNEIANAVGPDAAESLRNILLSSMIDKNSVVMKAVGVGALIFGATTMFFQLQRALNELWDVKATPKKAVVKYLLDRANSLGMILIIGFLLLLTTVLSSLIGLANNFISLHFGLDTYYLVNTINLIVSFLIVVILFAFMFKVLPDVEISWRSVWVGAFLTALLFSIGKWLLSVYFGNFKPTSAFGAAGSVILIMMWINYSCMLIFYGVVFTKVYTYKKGLRIRPSKHAKWLPERTYTSEFDRPEDLMHHNPSS